MTITYYAPRPRPVNPRATPVPRRPVHGDVRRTLGAELPDGFTWTHRPALALVHGGDPTAPGPDEREARARMIHAINRRAAS
ncbi:hypothetical protein OHA04_27470 [Streptomyces sp. NBC_01590]|uniref:hypothetical protein n=1 Tax=Streptomyces sp. NBC_01590 TaxID=2975887 RepID=UPI003862E1FA